MLAFTIGLQEVIIIVLFLVGILVIPIPGRWLRRRGPGPLRSSNEFEAPPIPSIHAAAEAFFCSYPQGEYTLQQRERFRMTFRRGRWERRSPTEIVPAAEAGDEPEDLPVILRVLIQPRPDSLLLTVKHEALPGAVAPRARKKELARRFRAEARDFQAYIEANFPPREPQPRRWAARRIDAVRKRQ